MKYYLIIGYQTLEKFRDYGRIQLYFNDLLLEDFTADEENGITNIFHNTVINADTEMLDTIKHSKRPKEDIVESPLIYKGRTFHSVNELIDMIKNGEHNIDYKIFDSDGHLFDIDDCRDDFLEKLENHKQELKKKYEQWIIDNQKSLYQVNESQPRKIKILEIDSKEFQRTDITKLTIKIVGGPSNYTNGFMNKRNMVVIFPVFLLPKSSLNFNLLNRFYNKMKKHFLSKYKLNSYPFYIANDQVPQPNKDGTYTLNENPIQWPGPTYIPIDEKSKNCLLLGQPIGNDCEMNFYIHKKHKIYSIHTSPKPPKGKWQLNLCFINLYEKLAKRCVTLKEWMTIKSMLQKQDK